jgi:hypothetical protein
MKHSIAITTRELALLLAMIDLESRRQDSMTTIYNPQKTNKNHHDVLTASSSSPLQCYTFEMVFQKVLFAYRKQGMKAPLRMDALKALENLLSLQLVHEMNVKHHHLYYRLPATLHKQTQRQPEYRLVKLTIRPMRVVDAIKKKEISACTTFMEQWALHGI